MSVVPTQVNPNWLSREGVVVPSNIPCLLKEKERSEIRIEPIPLYA